jgi:hypothetical protein
MPMSMERRLRDIVADIATATQRRLFELERQVAELETKKAHVGAHCEGARDALKRLAAFPVMNGSDFICPHCWVRRLAMSPLERVPSDKNHERFRCSLCHEKIEIVRN